MANAVAQLSDLVREILIILPQTQFKIRLQIMTLIIYKKTKALYLWNQELYFSN